MQPWSTAVLLIPSWTINSFQGILRSLKKLHESNNPINHWAMIFPIAAMISHVMQGPQISGAHIARPRQTLHRDCSALPNTRYQTVFLVITTMMIVFFSHWTQYNQQCHGSMSVVNSALQCKGTPLYTQSAVFFCSGCKQPLTPPTPTTPPASFCSYYSLLQFSRRVYRS